jgi:ferredoxin
MSVKISEECVTCGACLWECPNGAIIAGDPRPHVEAELCTECFGMFGEGQCIVVCPVQAFLVNPESLEELERRFARLHPGLPLQDTWIWERRGSLA